MKFQSRYVCSILEECEVVQFCSMMFYVNRHSALTAYPKQNKCGIAAAAGEGSLRPRKFWPFQLFSY